MKKIFIYFWIILISISIEIPSYISILNIEFETSLLLDVEEEVEDAEVLNDNEAKFYTPFSSISKNISPKTKNEIVFITKTYTSLFQNLESPPPKS